MKLLKKCKKERVPFHQWYRWVEQETLRIAREQRPDLYGYGGDKKPTGFISRIKRIFKKDQTTSLKNTKDINTSVDHHNPSTIE